MEYFFFQPSCSPCTHRRKPAPRHTYITPKPRRGVEGGRAYRTGCCCKGEMIKATEAVMVDRGWWQSTVYNNNGFHGSHLRRLRFDALKLSVHICTTVKYSQVYMENGSQRFMLLLYYVINQRYKKLHLDYVIISFRL